MPSALVVGYDPQAIPGVDGDALRAALEAELARFADHGIDAAMTLVEFNAAAEPTLVTALTERPWDVVVIGGGIRKAAPCSPSSNTSSTSSSAMRPRRRSRSTPRAGTAWRRHNGGCRAPTHVRLTGSATQAGRLTHPSDATNRSSDLRAGGPHVDFPLGSPRSPSSAMSNPLSARRTAQPRARRRVATSGAGR